MNRNDQTTGTSTAPVFFGARSEDSALFRVDAGAMAPAAAGALRGASESSGYIAVGDYTAERDRDAASASQFEANAGLGELSAASAMIRPVLRDDAPTSHVSRGLLQGAIAAVSVAIVTGLFGIAYHGMPAPQQPRSVPVAAPMLMELESEPTPQTDDDEAEAADEPADELATDDDDDRILDDEETAALTAAPKRASSKSKAKRSTSKKAAKPKAKPAPEPEPEPAAKPAKKQEELPREMSVECLLNPKSCMDNTPKKAKEPSAPSGPELPSKLSLSQLKAGTNATRDAARDQCAELASAGEKVQVKLSIAGATGRVTKTSVLGAAAGTSLGKCVARVLADSSFERTLSPQQGTLVTVRF